MDKLSRLMFWKWDKEISSKSHSFGVTLHEEYKKYFFKIGYRIDYLEELLNTMSQDEKYSCLDFFKKHNDAPQGLYKAFEQLKEVRVSQWEEWFSEKRNEIAKEVLAFLLQEGCKTKCSCKNNDPSH